MVIMSKSVLVVDDDDKLRKLLVKYLSDNGFHVVNAMDAVIALELLNNEEIDIIILDVMMPGESGINFVSRIRNVQEYKEIPVLMLSALNEGENRINGLISGADDYLAKPFEPQELLIRLNNLLKRSKHSNKNIKTATFGNFTFYMDSLKLKKNGINIDLSSTEANLLKILVSAINKTMSREDITSMSFGISERSIDVQIARLRQKIEDDPAKPIHIITVRNQGYGLFDE